VCTIIFFFLLLAVVAHVFLLQVTVPHGESFTLIAPQGDPFLWKANLTAGTSVVFTVKDAQNRVGGTSQVLNVGASDDSSCLGPPPVSAPPTRLPQISTASSPNPSRTNTPNSGSGSRGKDNKTDNKTGIIIGSSVGGSVGLLVIVALIFCLTKRKGRRNGVEPNDLHGSALGVSTSFLPPGQMQHSDQVPPAPYFVNPNVGAPPTSRSNGFSPVQMQVAPSPYSVNSNVVAPLMSRSNGFSPAQVQYHGQVVPTPHFVNPNVGAQPKSRSNDFPPGSSMLANVGGGPNISSSTAAAMPNIVETAVSAGTMDTKANHSEMGFNQEAMQPQGGERHLYFDPYTRNWPQQDYDFNRYADASSSSQKIENMSGSGAGPAFMGDGEGTSPQTGKSLPTSSLTTSPRHLIVHTDMEDELPPTYSDIRTGIPGSGR
jgi:hypothetical protein